MTGRRLAIILTFLALIAGAGAAYVMLGDGESISKRQAPTAGLDSRLVGEMSVFELAPDRPPMPADIALEGPEGPVRLGDLKGRVLLVNLWAEWCAPCIEELPTLEALDAALGGEDFRVVPVSLDRRPVAEAQETLRKFGAEGLTTLADREMALMSGLSVMGLPTTFLVDREGREIGRYVGPADWSSDEAKALIAAAIAGDG